MQEIKAIVAAYDAIAKLGIKSALATVVHVSGSSYRRPGARMLVTEQGQLTGAISGGCLEGDALRKAVLAITQGKNKLVVYDTTDEDDAKLGIQLGCNGVVSILFEPIQLENPQPINCLRASIATRKDFLLVTGYSLNQQAHFGTICAPYSQEIVATGLPEISKQVLQLKLSRHELVMVNENEQQFFFEYIQPPIALFIIGAGNDAIPLAKIAALIGWSVTLIDGRATHANRQRFPQVDQILVGKPPTIIDQLSFDERTALVLMTHNYQYDIDLFSLLIDQPIGYLGLLGPASKRDRMLADLSLRGLNINDQYMKKIFGPTGLNLGAETAEEIALSISSEIMSVLMEKEPIHLKKKLAPIHEQT